METFRQFLENSSIEIWLDDERDPSKPDIQEDFGARPGMTWCKTVPEAKTLLKTGKVTYLSFDNDLGLPEEGYHLAKWIEIEAHDGHIPRLMWTVHSKNMPAVRYIIMAMKNADKFWTQYEQKSQ